MLGASRKVRLELATQEDVEIDADEDLVRRMLMNLLENAVRHTGVGTSIQVELKRQNGRIEIAVRDEGSGIPAEERDRIFERFVRLESAPGGAGLGLPIARWIAEAHGGSLTLAESSPAGSRFVVRLPISTAGQPA
jgi:signal transduction histidine kinase